MRKFNLGVTEGAIVCVLSLVEDKLARMTAQTGMKFRRCLAPIPPSPGPPGMVSPYRGPCPGGVVLATDY